MKRGGRPRRGERPTPHVDAWRERVGIALEERGSKAALSRHLAGSDDPAKMKVQQVKVWKALTGRDTPDGELVLAILAWLDSRKSLSTADGGRRRLRMHK